MRKSNQLEGKTPTKKSKPSTPRSSTTRTPRSNLEPPKSNPNSGSNIRKSNRPFSPSVTAPTASSVSRYHSHPYSKINWNDESEILEKFPLIQDRGVLPVPTELLQSRYSFMDKAKVVREWRALYPDEQVDISHQWSVQRKRLKEQVGHSSISSYASLPQSIADADADASNDIISPKKLDFQTSSAADIKMDNNTDITSATTDNTTNDDEDQAMDVDEENEQRNSTAETKNEGTTGNAMDAIPAVDDANRQLQTTSNVTNGIKSQPKQQQNQKEEMLLHEQFDKCSNIGLITTIDKDGDNVITTTTPNKKHLPLKEEPMYSESTTSLGKSRRSSASSVSSSGIYEESLIPVIDATKLYEQIININNDQEKNGDGDEDMQMIIEQKDPSSAIEDNNNNENSIINNNNKSFALEDESAMYFESTMSIGKSKCDDGSSISSANVIDNIGEISNNMTETLVEIEEMSNMKQL